MVFERLSRDHDERCSSQVVHVHSRKTRIEAYASQRLQVVLAYLIPAFENLEAFRDGGEVVTLSETVGVVNAVLPNQSPNRIGIPEKIDAADGEIAVTIVIVGIDTMVQHAPRFQNPARFAQYASYTSTGRCSKTFVEK